MKIVGLQKLTLLDFPGHVACTIFLGGCNFKCPFCYNSSLIGNNFESLIDENFLFSFLEKRKGKLDGVAITGGEPLLNPKIKNFIKKIKNLGYLVKLDTNGSFPDVLATLIEENLVDYVAMDVKNSFEKYHQTTGVNLDVKNVKKSIEILLKNKVNYEFRTTLIKEFHTLEDIHLIGEAIKGAQNHYFQNFQAKESVLNSSLHPCDKEQLLEFEKVMKSYVKNCSLRGIE